jgi:phospho-N-acetylmuramoyl-pentapeptide-transferase
LFQYLTILSSKPIIYLFVSFLFTFVFTALLMPVYINWLKHFQIGQFIREEGPSSHAVKAKTPTTGGVFFIIAVSLAFILISVINHYFNPTALAVLLVAIACGLIGLVDDAAKIFNKANKGLSASKRLLLETIFGAIFAGALLYMLPQAKDIILTMSSYITTIGESTAHVFSLPVFIFIPLVIAVIVATTNSVNLNDGMDGLAAGVAFPIFLTLAILLIKTNNLSLALIAMAGAGVLVAFLIYNWYPAKIFMGDVGSLFLGGLIASLVLASGLTLWFIPLAVLYILETLSVIIQVSYFKLTKPYQPPKPINKLSLAMYKLTHKLPGEGKRIFRMSPLHHHFEAVMAEKGISEWQVVLGFWFVQLFICSCVLAAFSRF